MKIVCRLVERQAEANPVVKWISREINCIDDDGEMIKGFEYMSSAILDDVQSKEACDKVMAGIHSVERGELENYCWSGNAWSTTITKSGVTFEHQWIEELIGGEVTLNQFKAAIEAWRRFLGDASCDHCEIDLPDT